MILDNLYLEITRNCTIKCEHCLRGDKEIKNMSIVTLNNILKETSEIKHLLLSGGEPLINIKLLEELPKLIEKYNIEISTISIITNGTIIGDRIINALESIQNHCGNFNFILSNDLFHKLEWQRLNVEDKVKRNFEYYQKSFSMSKYPINDSFSICSLTNKGKAKELTKDRINEITRNKYTNYIFKDIPADDNLSYEDNQVHGKICIDTNGNIVDYCMTYEEEDTFSSNGLNVNIFPFSSVLKVYIDDYIKRNYGSSKKKDLTSK